MKKRMLYLSVYDPHVPYTGAGVRGGEFVTNLAQRFDLDLIYLEGSGHPGDPVLEDKFEWRVQGVNKKIKIPFTLRNYFLYSEQLLLEAENLISQKKYDVVLADYGLSAIYGIKLKKKYGIPFVYCSHNLEFKQYLGKAKKDKRRYVLVPWVYHVEKTGVKMADILVPISESEADYYTRWRRRNDMHVVPQGFNEDIFNPNYKPKVNGPKLILFFGNYNIVTNRDAVYAVRHHIVDKVVARYPNVKFQFIGANPPDDIDHLNMEFLGFVEHLEDYLKNCDIMISPILAGWGMPTKIIESLACGKQIVATKTAARGVPEKYKTLHLVEIDQFADKIVELLQQNKPVDDVDFELLKQEFAWDRTIGKLADKIEQLIK